MSGVGFTIWGERVYTPEQIISIVTEKIPSARVHVEELKIGSQK